MAASWLVSCFLHGSLAVVAIVFVQRMHVAPQTEPFQWNIAMVAPVSLPAGSAPRAESTTPPTTPLRKSAPPATDANQVARQMHAKMTTVAPPPTPATEFTAESHQEPHRTTEASRQVSSRSPTTPLPPQTTLQHLTVPFDAADPLAPVQDSSTSPLESQIHPDPPLSSASSAHASTASPDRVTSAKADYGWLTDLMARWIEDLNKRYPATLRAEGVEGKVLLTAILRDDGLLSDVRVVKGSGNATLDEVALEDVRNGPLIPLSRPLERAQMPVKFSIIYDLKTVR